MINDMISAFGGRYLVIKIGFFTIFAILAIAGVSHFVTLSSSPMKNGAPEAAPPQESHTGLAVKTRKLLDIMFPRRVPIVGYTYGYVERQHLPVLADETQVSAHHSRSINVGKTEKGWIELTHPPLDSYWRFVLSDPNGEQSQFTEAVAEADAIVKEILADKVSFPSSLDKAVFHRDVLAMCQVANYAKKQFNGRKTQRAVQELLNKFILLLRRSSFKVHELQEVREFLSRYSSRGHFNHSCSFNLSENYLPDIVCGPSPGWYEFPSDEDARAHFDAYGGRCFIKIYLKAPGKSEDGFYRYWATVTQKFGFHTTRTTGLPLLPKGTETVLIRTFGVFMEDGTFADSLLPEEILVRIFNYQKPKLDMTTSDFLGTIIYQYKLKRDKLATEPETIGLERIREDDGQFFGFFSELPERAAAVNSGGNLYTNMRSNCIACHSEVFYGPSTVYSLSRREPAPRGAARVEGGKLEPINSVGWRVKNDDVGEIQSRLLGLNVDPLLSEGQGAGWHSGE
jgi:hypothetical protein